MVLLCIEIRHYKWLIRVIVNKSDNHSSVEASWGYLIPQKAVEDPLIGNDFIAIPRL